MCPSAGLSGASNEVSSLESQMDTATEENEGTAAVTETGTEKPEGNEEMVVEEKAGKDLGITSVLSDISRYERFLS